MFLVLCVGIAQRRCRAKAIDFLLLLQKSFLNDESLVVEVAFVV